MIFLNLKDGTPYDVPSFLLTILVVHDKIKQQKGISEKSPLEDQMKQSPCKISDQISGQTRMHTVCWKIYRQGILLATVISIVYGILHSFSLSAFLTDGLQPASLSSFYILFLPEAVVSILGIVILSIGWIRYRKDPLKNNVSDKHRFYFAALKLFVTLAFAGYAFSLPFSDRWIHSDVSQNYLVLLFESLGVMYLYYALKKQDIFFNYSFIQKPGKVYYKRVFKNILGILLVLLCVFAAATVLDVILHESFKHFFTILPAYLMTATGPALEYLFISWTEKLSYDEKEHHGLHKGTFVKFLFLLWNTYKAFVFLMLQVSVAYGALGDWLISKGHQLPEVMTLISEAHRHFSHESTVLLVMVLCKLGCQIRTSKTARRAITGIFLMTVISFCWEYVSTFIIPHFSDFETYALFAKISGGISLLLSFASALLWTVMIRDLIRTERLSPMLWCVAGMRWLPIPLTILSSVTDKTAVLLFTEIIGGLISAISLLLFLILLHSHAYTHEHEEYV